MENRPLTLRPPLLPTLIVAVMWAGTFYLEPLWVFIVLASTSSVCLVGLWCCWYQLRASQRIKRLERALREIENGETP
jgi:hypothetical protein